MTTEGDELAFGWDALVPRVVHPLKVAIIEALRWIGQPLSATELKNLFDDGSDLSLISYHLVTLSKVEVLTIVRERRGRGSIEKFYFFA